MAVVSGVHKWFVTVVIVVHRLLCECGKCGT